MQQAILLFALAILTGTCLADGSGTFEPDAARRTELIRLVREDCGSCHGLTLKGGLGPALLPAALHGKDPAMLFNTIIYGRPGTPMPPWRTFLSDDEARWIVSQLQQGFPNETR